MIIFKRLDAPDDHLQVVGPSGLSFANGWVLWMTIYKRLDPLDDQLQEANDNNNNNNNNNTTTTTTTKTKTTTTTKKTGGVRWLRGVTGVLADLLILMKMC